MPNPDEDKAAKFPANSRGRMHVVGIDRAVMLDRIIVTAVGGALPVMAIGGDSTERATLFEFRLEVYKRVGFSQVEV